jgi:PAS domain S-box-containing protein
MTPAPEPSRPPPTDWYRRLVDEVRDYAIFLTDLEGRVIGWNGGAERLLGWTEAEILGQSSFRMFVPEDIAAGAAARELATAAAEGRAEDERWHLRKDGSRFWGSGIMTAVHDDAGALIGFGKIMRDRTAQRQLEARLRASLQDKEVLLKEMYHRVKNNLQVVVSLLDLQADALADPQARAVFDDCQRRIQAMALIHEALSQASSLARVHLGDYARRLAEGLVRGQSAQPERLRLTLAADEVWVSAEKAVPCGLILNELLTNCVKHAFPGGRAGEIRLGVRADAEGVITLSVADDGVGVPPEVDCRQTDSLGLQLVGLLTEQLGGTITFERRGGTAVTVRFSA